MLDEFLDAYITTALWSSSDESDPETGGDPMDANYSESDIAPETLDAMRADCAAFLETADALISEESCLRYGPDFGPVGHAGHDFWLTRNGHGAGFWDGDWREPEASQLDKTARAFRPIDLYVGDDGRIYGS